MATFQVKDDGLITLIERMKAAGEALDGPIADKMLMAGAEKTKQAWQHAIEKHGLINTGSMHDSVVGDKTPTNIGNMRVVSIYPRGKGPDGRKNAVKAFMLNYSKNGHKGSGWVDDAERECMATVVPAMAAVFDEELKKKGL